MLKGSSPRTLGGVLEARLCIGCGACAAFCGKGAVQLFHDETAGIHPVFTAGGCGECRECIAFCPGAGLEYEALRRENEGEWHPLLGPCLGVYEGHATDPEVRFRGSSGGVISALSLYCLETRKSGFVLQTGMDPDVPWHNRSVVSSNRRGILEHAGSRYAPSSPCDSIQEIARSDRDWLFVGKPCDAAAVYALRARWPALDERLSLVLSFFCAGTPVSGATRAFLTESGIAPETVTSIRYRGCGWPGSFEVFYDGGRASRSFTYQESWGKLAAYRRPLRCNLCPDGMGDFSDIACGDAWHLYDNGQKPGLSVVVVRTARGKRILENAVKDRYLEVWPSSPDKILSGQGLQNRRMELFGRLLALRLMGWPQPDYHGLNAKALWRGLPSFRKFRVVAGTARRMIVRRYLNRFDA